jgi:hypothetical protein
MPDPATPTVYRFRGRLAAAAFLWGAAALFAALVLIGSITAVRGGSIVPLLLGPFFVAAGALVGVMAAGLPAAVACPSPAGLAVRFPIAIDRTIPWSDISGAVLARHPLWHGLGIRLAPHATVALATLPGPCAEVVFRTPQQVTLLPGIARANPRRLRLTVERPADLVAAIESRVQPDRRS